MQAHNKKGAYMNDEKLPQGRAKGGVARAANLTPEQRSDIARKGALAKKAKQQRNLPKADYRGVLKIGDIEIPCCVLNDGRRIITENGINATLGSTGGKSYKLRDAADDIGVGPLPLFLASKALQPFIHETFEGMDLSMVEYTDGGKDFIGYAATILPKVCEVWLKAKDGKTLQASQFVKAKKAEILMRGLAHVGITALVDEATGYQKDRAKDELAKILEAFVAKELQPYMKTFPVDFYEQLFRLRGLKYPPENPKFRPQYFGLLTNDIVYERIAPGLLVELKRQSSKDEKKAHLHRRLTQELGHPKLREHLAAVVMAMKLSTDYKDFISKLNQFYPRFGDSFQLDLDVDDRG